MIITIPRETVCLETGLSIRVILTFSNHKSPYLFLYLTSVSDLNPLLMNIVFLQSLVQHTSIASPFFALYTPLQIDVYSSKPCRQISVSESTPAISFQVSLSS